MTRILFILALLTQSCSTAWMTRAVDRETFNYVRSGFYFKNASNGLCFFVINSYRTIAPTCVPCDSLKKERLLVFYPQKLKP